MAVTKFIIALLLVLATITLAEDCRVSLRTAQRSAWSSDAGDFTLYDVSVVNSGSVSISDVVMTTSSSFESSWEIKYEGGQYSLPDWRHTVTVEPGTAHEFGYIIAGSVPAQWEIVSCNNQAPAPAPSDAPVPVPEAPTDAATDAPAAEPEAPTDAATDAPAPEPEAPTDAATDAPAAEPEAPTDETDAPAPEPETPTTDSEVEEEPATESEAATESEGEVESEAPADDADTATDEVPADEAETPTDETPAEEETPADEIPAAEEAPVSEATEAPATEELPTLELTPDEEVKVEGSKTSYKGSSSSKGKGKGKGKGKHTSRPTPTKAPSNPSTKAPSTKAPTNPSTKAPSTKAPTNPSTKAPTNPSTKAPSNPSTKAPSTKAPAAPSTAPSGGSCATGTWWKPAPGTTWQWQLTGTIDQSVDVQMYDIDLFDASASLINSLHAKGRVVVCYFSTQYEDWRPDAKDFTKDTLGSALDGWPGENWVNIKSPKLREIMKKRLVLAQSKGCDGVEPDNVDGYSNGNGLGLTAADQLDFNKYLANTAHSLGLSIGLKNDLDQAKALEPYFDWALNEQCNQYGECAMLDVFINAGKAVFNTEYSGSKDTVCKYMVGKKFSSIMKKLALDASISAQCCTYAANGCAKVASACGGSTSAILAEDGAQKLNYDAEAYRIDSAAVSLSHPTIIFLVATFALALLF